MPLTPGQWHTVICPLGHTHEVYIQKKTDECAISCAAMVINRVAAGHPKPDPADLRLSSQDFSGGYKPSPEDAGARMGEKSTLKARLKQESQVKRGLSGPTTGPVSPKIRLMQQSLAHTYRGAGTTTAENLPQLLAADPWKIHWARSTKATDSDALREMFKKVKANNPCVLRVAWDGGGGHAVLLDAHKSHVLTKDEFCVCDPGLGVVVVTFAPDDSFTPSGEISKLPYTPNYNGHVNSGHIRLNFVRVA
jgi:hypothetical protein